MNPLRTLSDAATKVLFRAAEVTAVVDHGGDLRTIELAGTELRGASWTPGDKVQIRMDGFTTRTYTPTRWDAEAGTTSLLAFSHGAGPGSAWMASLAGGEACRLFGPRRSVRLDQLDGLPVLVGDETSLGLGLAWRALHPGAVPAAELYEAAGEIPLDVLGLAGAGVVARDDLADAVVAVARAHPDAPLCLTGRAQTIAPLRRALKAAGLAGRPTKVKAYWDENRTGLD